jgi:hypothetical protein
MMKKENFVKLVNMLIDQDERDGKVHIVLGELNIEGMLAFDITDKMKSSVIEVLEEEMNDPYSKSDHGSLISWWLYDAPDAGKCLDSAWIQMENGEKIPLETPEQLYDYLLKEV